MNNKILYFCLDSSKIKSPQKEFHQHHNRLQPIQLTDQNHCQELSLRLRKLEISTAKNPFQAQKRPLWTSSIGLHDFCRHSKLIVTFLLALSGPRLPLVMSWLCLIFNTLKKQTRWLGFSDRIYRALSDIYFKAKQIGRTKTSALRTGSREIILDGYLKIRFKKEHQDTRKWYSSKQYCKSRLFRFTYIIFSSPSNKNINISK